MQLKQAVDSAYQRFIAAEVPSPRLNAEILMTFTLGRDRSYLFAHPERELSPKSSIATKRSSRSASKAVPRSTSPDIRSSGGWICWFLRRC